MNDTHAVPSNEEELCAQRVELLTEGRKVMREILDRFAELADLQRELRELRMADKALMEEIRSHRIGIVHTSETFDHQMRTNNTIREVLQKIERKTGQWRERFARLGPPQAVTRRPDDPPRWVPLSRTAPKVRQEIEAYDSEMKARAKQAYGRKR